jgi:hypothetical protein
LDYEAELAFQGPALRDGRKVKGREGESELMSIHREGLAGRPQAKVKILTTKHTKSTKKDVM